ncbi:MAG: rod shape-determining protein MreD [Bacilli bacterium]|nr:rod shape-determining protein MreD [Bacilli bacterium]
MVASIIIVLVSLLLDGLLTNYLPYLVGDLSLFTPLLTVVSIFIVYPYFYKNNKLYFIFSFVSGLVYDLFYTNLLFVDGILFLIVAFLTVKMTANIQINAFNVLYETLIVIIVYEVLFAILIVVFNLVPITLSKVLYKISHTLLLNIIYTEIIYFILKSFNRKYFRKSIN